MFRTMGVALFNDPIDLLRETIYGGPSQAKDDLSILYSCFAPNPTTSSKTQCLKTT